MKVKKIISLFLVLVLFLFVTGCGSKNETKDPSGEATSTHKTESNATDEKETKGSEEATTKGKFRIGYASKNQDNPFQQSFVNEMNKQAKERGWEVTILDARGKIETEQENMDTFISQKYDLIFINSVDPLAGVQKCLEAKAAGIPVIAIDSNVDKEAEVVTLVVAPNLSGGFAVGKYLVTCYKDDVEIKAAMLSGNKGNTGGQERRVGLFAGVIAARTGVSEKEGFEKAWQLDQELTDNGKATNEEAKFTIVGQGWGNWNTDDGLAAAEDLIIANDDLNCMLAENDSMLIGGYKALENSNKLDAVQLFASHDAMKEALELVKNGTQYKATGLNLPKYVVAKGWSIADQILVDGKDPDSFEKLITTDPIAITIENVDEFYDPNADF